MKYDLIIIGAGVAATSALISLRTSGLRIALIAPSQRPAFKIGETLGPGGINELRSLGLSEIFNTDLHWRAFQKFSSWGTPQLLPSKAGGQHSLYLDRILFEQQLWEQGRETPFEHFDEKVTLAENDKGFWNIKTEGHEFQSQMVLDASGRSSILGRYHFNRTRHDKLVGLYVVLNQVTDDVEPTRATMIEARPEGWFYSVLIPGNRMVVSWFTDSDLLPKGQHEQQKHFAKNVHQSEYTLKRIETAGFQLNKEVQITDASTITNEGLAKNNLILAGDAATCFDPLSSHGITTGLWSGRKSAMAIQSLQLGDPSKLSAYVDSFRKGTEKYLREKQEIYQLETRFSKEVFWKRRNGKN